MCKAKIANIFYRADGRGPVQTHAHLRVRIRRVNWPGIVTFEIRKSAQAAVDAGPLLDEIGFLGSAFFVEDRESLIPIAFLNVENEIRESLIGSVGNG